MSSPFFLKTLNEAQKKREMSSHQVASPSKISQQLSNINQAFGQRKSDIGKLVSRQGNSKAGGETPPPLQSSYGSQYDYGNDYASAAVGSLSPLRHPNKSISSSSLAPTSALFAGLSQYSNDLSQHRKERDAKNDDTNNTNTSDPHHDNATTDIMAELKKMKYLQKLLAEGRERAAAEPVNQSKKAVSTQHTAVKGAPAKKMKKNTAGLGGGVETTVSQSSKEDPSSLTAAAATAKRNVTFALGEVSTNKKSSENENGSGHAASSSAAPTHLSSSPPRILQPISGRSEPSRLGLNRGEDDVVAGKIGLGEEEEGNSGGGHSHSPSSTDAASSVFVRPQMIVDVEKHIRKELQKLNVLTSRQLKEIGGNASTVVAENSTAKSSHSGARAPNSSSSPIILLPAEPPSDEALERYTWDPTWDLLVGQSGKASRPQEENAGDTIAGSVEEKTRDARVRLFGFASPLKDITKPNPQAENEKRRVNAKEASSQSKPYEESAAVLGTVNNTYRSQRMQIFSAGAKIFADQFKTYRKLLLWIFIEYDRFVSYCHDDLPAEGLAKQRAQLTQQLRAEFESERENFTAVIAKKDEEIEQLKTSINQLESLTSSGRKMIQERDFALESKERELIEAAEGRVALLSRIQRLEKELWRQQELSEEPEKRIKHISRDLSDLRDKVQHYAKALASSEDTANKLRAQLERSEETLRDRQRNEQQMATKAQYQSWKRREVELLELNAQLTAKNNKLSGQLEAALGQISRGREAASTPRPMWALVDKSFPEASTTGQRVRLANELIIQNNEELGRVKAELITLRGMYTPSNPMHFISPVGHLPICLHEEQWLMVSPYIPKLGLDTRIPAYLRGVGKAVNHRLSRDEVTSYCHLMWFEKELARPTTPWEDIISNVLHKYCPPPPPLPLSQHHQLTTTGLNNDSFSPSSFAASMSSSSLSGLVKSTSGNNPMSETAGGPSSITNTTNTTTTTIQQQHQSLHYSDVAYSLFYAMQWYSFDPFIRFTRESVLGLIDDSCMLTIFDAVKRLKSALIAKAQISDDVGDTPQGHVSNQNNGRSAVSTNRGVGLNSDISDESAAATTDLTFDPTMANKPQWIARSAAVTVLLNAFPLFSSRMIKKLSDTLNDAKTSPKNASLINIPSLFVFDSARRKRSRLITELILIKIDERSDLVKSYVEALNECEDGGGGSGGATNANATIVSKQAVLHTLATARGVHITPHALAKRLWAFDPSIPTSHMDQLMCYYFEHEIEQLVVVGAPTMPSSTKSSNKDRGEEENKVNDYDGAAHGTIATSLAARSPSSACASPLVVESGGERYYADSNDLALEYRLLFDKMMRRPAHRFSEKRL